MSQATEYGLRMHRFDDADAGILAYEVDGGDLTEDKADPVWARIDEARAADRKIRIFAEMHAIPHVEGAVVMDKLKRMGALFSTIERIAIVGDHGWLGLYEKIADPITRFDIKHFTTNEEDAALEWLKS